MVLPRDNPLALIAAEALGLGYVPSSPLELHKAVIRDNPEIFKDGEPWTWDHVRAYQTLHRLLMETNNGSQ